MTRRLICIVNTSVFFTFVTSSSQSKPSKNTGIYSVLTRQNAQKTRCLEAIFRDFSARAPQVKNQRFFTLFLPPLIQSQDGVKSQKIARLHLNSTFFMSQSLPQSSKSIICPSLSGPQNAVNYGVFILVPCVLPAFQVAPPLAKATCC